MRGRLSLFDLVFMMLVFSQLKKIWAMSSGIYLVIKAKSFGQQHGIRQTSFVFLFGSLILVCSVVAVVV